MLVVVMVLAHSVVAELFTNSLLLVVVLLLLHLPSEDLAAFFISGWWRRLVVHLLVSFWLALVVLLCRTFRSHGSLRRSVEVDVRWRRWEVGGILHQATLEVENVITKLEVLVLKRAEIIFHVPKLLDLFLELLDVTFLALAECALS